MTIDASDNNDGITFERGTKPNRVRAVVMRHGQRVVSDWRKSKGFALRNLVVKLTWQLSQYDNEGYDWESGTFYDTPDTLRETIAEGLEGLAFAQLAADENHAELFHIKGKEHVVMSVDRLYRGAFVLRWVHRRESKR